METLEQQKRKQLNTTTAIAYPMWAWDGTPYADFADACRNKGKDENFIPKRFFVESLKTVVGAICGHRLKRPGSKIEARFYTVIMADEGGTGKSTGRDWSINNLFAGTGLTLTVGEEKTANRSNIGCIFGGFASDPGLRNRLAVDSRVLQSYDELAIMVDKFGISGSGQSLLALNNELFESTVPPTSETKEDRKNPLRFSGPVHNSILGCTIKEKWDEMFGNTAASNSGFFQRLNIVSAEGIKVVADLREPDLDAVRKKMLAKILPLENRPCEIYTTDEAREFFEAWFKEFRIRSKGTPSDVRGRINVIVIRNAMQIAWLLSKDATGTTATITTDVMQRATALGDYQYLERLANRPLAGRNDYARLENAAKRELKKESPLSRSHLYDKTHAERFGEGALDLVIDKLTKADRVRVEVAKAEQGSRAGGRGKMLVHWLGED